MLTLVGRSLVGGALMVGAVFGCSEKATPPTTATSGAGSGSTASTGGIANILRRAQLGNPQLGSIDRLSFGPSGVLLLADVRFSQIVAIETGDNDSKARFNNAFKRIDQLNRKVANALGDDVPLSDVVVRDIAVNPTTWRTYLAVSRLSTDEAFLLTVGPDDTFSVFHTDNVLYAATDMTSVIGTPALLRDLAWSDAFVVTLVAAQQEPHELTFVKTPFAHRSGVRHESPIIFHRDVGWTRTLNAETMLFLHDDDEDESFLVTAYDSAVVRFSQEDLMDEGSEPIGGTVFSFLGGRRAIDFATYEDGGDAFVMAAVDNFLFDGKPRTVRIRRDLFFETSLINEQARDLFDFLGTPRIDGVQRVTSMDLATRIEMRGDRSVVILGQNRLETVAIP